MHSSRFEFPNQCNTETGDYKKTASPLSDGGLTVPGSVKGYLSLIDAYVDGVSVLNVAAQYLEGQFVL